MLFRTLNLVPGRMLFRAKTLPYLPLLPRRDGTCPYCKEEMPVRNYRSQWRDGNEQGGVTKVGLRHPSPRATFIVASTELIFLASDAILSSYVSLWMLCFLSYPICQQAPLVASPPLQLVPSLLSLGCIRVHLAAWYGWFAPGCLVWVVCVR